MERQLKPLHEQTIVLTGATSGIGLVTARMAADAGAQLVLAARNEEALQELVNELKETGVGVIHVAANVGKEEDVRRIAEAAISHFGGFDTWINDAAVSIYGKLEEVSIEDQRQLFETNYWGVVYGSLIACEHLRKRGGKLINVASALAERAIPIQGVYSASKAAVLNYTEALRMELMQDDAPVSVSLIKPGAIDSPYKQHAANYLEVEAKNPPPVYAPAAVAKAILHAAERDVRDIVVGGGGKVLTALGNLFPGITDRIMSWSMPLAQRTQEKEPGIRKGSLYEPGEDLQERGNYKMTLEHSAYTAARRHPVMTTVLVAGTAAAAYRYLRKRNRPHV